MPIPEAIIYYLRLPPAGYAGSERQDLIDDRLIVPGLILVILVVGGDAQLILEGLHVGLLVKLDACGLQKRCFIINQVDLEILRSGNVPGIEHIARNMNTPLAGIIPYDENIHTGNNMGSPVVLASDSYIAKNFGSIALRIF